MHVFCLVFLLCDVILKLFYTCMCFLCNSRFKSSLELMLCVIDISTLNKTYLNLNPHRSSSGLRVTLSYLLWVGELKIVSKFTQSILFFKNDHFVSLLFYLYYYIIKRITGTTLSRHGK